MSDNIFRVRILQQGAVADELLDRAAAPDLKGWGFASQMLPSI
ncbi:hypothetical protein [Sphingopyxis sp.]|nr:hypothetical protein [Sphingopyxis sp.]